MPSVSQIASGAGLPLSVGMALLKVPTPYTIAAGAALSLVGLIDKIGQGRKAANKFTQNGGPQDIINKQLAAISSSNAPPAEKAQATEKAWTDFLSESNKFASANPKQATVVKQAIYKTPELTDTVKSLMGGKDPLDPTFTNTAAPGISQGMANPNPGPSVKGALLNAGLSAGSALAVSALNNRTSAAKVGQPGNTGDVSNPDWQGPLQSGQGRAVSAQSVYNPATGQMEQPLPTAPAAGTPPIASSAPRDTPPAPNSSLLAKIAPQLISGGTSLLAGVIGSNAAKNAATEQSNAALEAAKLNSEAGKNAIDFNREVLAQQQKNQQPWIDAGTGALTSIQNIVNGPGYAWNQTYTPPTAEEAMASPELQFQMQQGQKALEAYLRSTGSLMSGKAIKEINEFGQGVASQNYGNVANRKLQTYNTNYSNFANERAAQLNPQLSLAGLGQVSTGQVNSNLSTAANENSQIGLTSAANVGNLNTSASAARASGFVGSANALGGAVGQIGNNIMGQQSIQQILQAMGRA